MKSTKRNKKLTIMLVPHSGRGIKSIELTTSFFVSIIVGIVGIVASSMYFTYQYINSKAILQKTNAYIAERNDTLENISKEIQSTTEVSEQFSAELQRTKSLLQNTSLSSKNELIDQLRIGDFAQATELSSSSLTQDSDLASLLSLNKQIESNLPILENMNELVANQKSLFQDLPVFWPVRGARVSMEWGPNIHPIYGAWYIHKGIDLAALSGSPVQAVANGEITFIGYDKGYGLHIYVAHSYGFKSHYSHLSAILVNKGQKIEQGQVIGKLGSTGQVTGAHLHFELYLGNELIDPGVYMRVFNNYERPVGNR